MALPSFVQHPGLLADRGIVRSKKEGRVRIYALAPKPLEIAEHWLSEQPAMWERLPPRSNRATARKIRLEPCGTGTKYTAIAIHGNKESAEKHARMGFHDGWGKALDQLVALAKGM